MSDLGLLTYYLGLKVHQSAHGITVNQAAYAVKLLDKAGMVLVVGIRRVGETRECFVLPTICSVFSDVLINKQN